MWGTINHLSCKDGVHDSDVLLGGVGRALQAQHARLGAALAACTRADQRLVDQAQAPRQAPRQRHRLRCSACGTIDSVVAVHKQFVCVV